MICLWQQYCRRWVLPILLIVLMTQLIAPSAHATGVYQMTQPAPGNWVIDKAEVLSRVNEGAISSSLANLAKKTGKEVHFVIIRRLDYGETIETFTNALFEKWFPTPEAQANQVLLALDNLTNDAAIRTGGEVKSLLSDEIARSVAQETVLLPLKEGEKYNQAFRGASDRLVAVLSGNPDPGPPQLKEVQVEGTFATPEETKESNATVWVIGLLAAATIIPMATYYFYLYLQSQ
ncbi:MAG: TPM domain-containing protein [Scytolyngbya sp. HA4215-MV1]|nr:TPM domain-containing protein [Scytolyngbya sp. HA4215-MV1]